MLKYDYSTEEAVLNAPLDRKYLSRVSLNLSIEKARISCLIHV